MKRKLLPIAVLTVVAFFFTQCGEEDSCDADTICDVSVSVCCDADDVCTYTYNGDEYSESEITGALEAECSVAHDDIDVLSRLQDLRFRALGL